MIESHSIYLPLRMAARRLGVPMAWLKVEAQEGRIPHIKTGRTLRFNLDEARDALRRQSSDNIVEDGQ